MTDRPLSFWDWFLRGDNAGWKRFANGWLAFHLLVAAFLTWVVPVPLSEAAKAVLLPLAGVLVGMSFAWVGNALAIAQSGEIERLSEFYDGGYESYVHPYQTAILVILACLVAWALAGLGVFDQPCPWACSVWPYRFAGTLLYGLASIAVRECWHVVMGAQLLLLYQRAVRRLTTRPLTPGAAAPKPNDVGRGPS